MARNPGMRNQDVQELDLAKEGTVAFDEGNDIDLSGADEVIVTQREVTGISEKMATLQFMEEPVTINVHESTNENAAQYVFLAINGEGPGPQKFPYLPRGMDITVKRKFVDRLARARVVSYKSTERVNGAGEREVVYPKTSALLYPFSVVEDKNPRGRDWLRGLLSERA